jgi:CBS domain containing-hemolysin-like protein
MEDLVEELVGEIFSEREARAQFPSRAGRHGAVDGRRRCAT